MAEMKFGAYDQLQSNKLLFGIQIAHRTSGSDYTRYVDPSIDLSRCTIRWRNLLIGGQSAEPLTTAVTFTPRNLTCDNTAFTKTKDQIYEYMNSMYSVESQGALTLAHLRLAFTAFSPVFSGCKNLIDSLTTQNSSALVYAGLTNCNALWGTEAYDSSPCCSADVAYSQCCAPYSLNHSIVLPSQVLPTNIQSQCAAPECSSKVVNNYVRLLQKTNDVASGCSANFRSVAGASVISGKTSFIRACREEILGADLLGLPCESNSDCLAGRSCLPSGRCDHNESLVMDCFASRIDPVVGTFLLRRWGVSGAYSKEKLRSEMPLRIFNTTCIGGNAVRYRDHYWYQTTTPFCSDDCKLSESEPRCLESSCSVPDICDRSVTGNSCWRFWSFNRADSVGCLADRYCSWIDCKASFPSDSVGCEAACTNASLIAQPVCVQCSTPYSCATNSDIEAFDETRCNVGLCTADLAETDATACRNKGICTAKCRNPSNMTEELDCPSLAACSAAGVCSDSFDVAPAIASLIGSGDSICILPFDFESGTGASCRNSSAVQVASGCAVSDFQSRASCVAASGYWHVLAMNSSACAAVAPMECFDGDSGSFLGRSRVECQRCTSQWRAPYSWSRGEWTPGSVAPLRWVNREWKASNTLGTAINYPQFTEEVGKAIADDVSTAFLTESLCRFDNLLKTVGAVACDCTAARGLGSCFSSGAGARQIGVGRVCPSLNNSISVSPVTVYASPTALSADESCKVVRISLTPNDQFALSGLSALTSEIFKQRITNVFAVARNSLGAVVGQILSDAIATEYDGLTAIPMRVCILTVDSIPRDSRYTRYDMARLDATTNKIFVLGTNATYVSGEVCAQISNSGTYFAVATVPIWKEVPAYDEAQRTQSFVGAALYYFVVAFGVAQAFILSLWDRRNFVQRLLLIAVVTAFNLIRGAYLTLAPGTLDQAPGARYVFFEFPTFLFFSAYSVVLYLWTLVIQRSQKMGNTRAADRPARIFLLGINVFFYAVFILFIILFTTLGTSSSPCAFSEAQAQARLNESQRTLGIAYQAVIALICLILAAIFCVQGVRLVWLLRAFRTNESKSRSVRRILLTSTAAVCTVSFVVRCAVFIAASAGASLPVIVFVLLEVIPSLMVQWIMNPWNSLRQHSTKTGESSTKYSTNSRITYNSRRGGSGASAAPWATTTSGSSGSRSPTISRESKMDSSTEMSDTGESL